MAWGSEIEILEGWLAEGRKVPAGYLARPMVRATAAPIWDAFNVLSEDRPVGFGEGPIPFTAIDRYAERYGITDLDAFENFRSLIRSIDSEYLRIRATQREQEKEAAKAKEKPI